MAYKNKKSIFIFALLSMLLLPYQNCNSNLFTAHGGDSYEGIIDGDGAPAHTPDIPSNDRDPVAELPPIDAPGSTGAVTTTCVAKIQNNAVGIQKIVISENGTSASMDLSYKNASNNVVVYSGQLQYVNSDSFKINVTINTQFLLMDFTFGANSSGNLSYKNTADNKVSSLAFSCN